jgi:exonuclease SbcD
MKLAHTSDWHAGRVFKRVDRLPELASVLENLGDDLEREKVDVLLMSGDVFDSGAPVADAERVVFSFFKRLGRAGIETVVIAGNHDSPARMEAWAGLAELVGVRAVARPCPHDKGGALTLKSRAGGSAVVAAVPFASPIRFFSALELAAGETRPHQRYADGLKHIVANVTSAFRQDAVNVLMLHTHVEGAAFSGSERKVHLGEEWAATPQAIPASAHYVALGHIHKPQRLEAAPSPAHYAGSPLQMDFGEAGEQKSFVLVDARPGQPARSERVPYRGARKLMRVRATLADLERDAARLNQDGALLWVSVPLDAPDPDLNARVRQLLPNALRVEPEFKLRSLFDTHDATAHARAVDPGLLYSAFVKAQRGEAALDPELLQAFNDLYAQECQHD